MSALEIDFNTLIEGKPMKVMVDTTPVCLVKIKEEVFAVEDTCSHSEASLSEGELNGYRIECWLHGAEFDLRTGEAVVPPAVAPLKRFIVERNSDQLLIHHPNSQVKENK
jgi:3-phenylpropionate/trans-cinnamate dioxygenase ferredoxin subunit